MFYTYILYSKTIDKFYIGASENPSERLKKHKNKHSGYTSQTSDWEIVFLKKFDSKNEAFTFERKIKQWKSRKMIRKLILDNTQLLERPN